MTVPCLPSATKGVLALLVLLFVSSCGEDPVEPPPIVRDACAYHSDCPRDGVCYKLECYGTATCTSRSQCTRGAPVCENDRCICDTDINRCLPVCITDNDCSTDGYCLDGRCTPYPVAFDGAPPESGVRGDLQVGIGISKLDYPMGVSMAGYGNRSGPRTPYQRVLGGSNAWLDRPEVRAMVFDDGKELVVLLRIPTSWTTDFMVAETVRKVMVATGVNLLENLVTTSPHSHSHPGRYWHLVNGLGFGFFGYGDWSYEVFDRMTTSFADAVIMAMDARAPARFGYVVLDDFDPENRIHSDRRERNNNLPGYMRKDGRMILMRVDDGAGEPIAILTNFGIHGTVFGSDNPIITGDAGGGIEGVLTERASEKYARNVTGFFVQGNAGDISPRGDDRSHNDSERVQLLGERTWSAVEDAFDAIETSASTRVSVMSKRIPITHEDLGYEENTFFDEGISCEDTPEHFRYGAFQCVEGYLEDEDPNTAFSDGDLACVFGVECLTGGHPVPQFQKTPLAVVRLGSLALASMPGEPLSNFGRDFSERLIETMDGVEAGAVLGYSQDHHFYLMKEDDWLQGGYEPSRDIWGWKLAPYLVENSLALAAELNKEPEDRLFERTGNIKPMYWVDSEEENRPVELTETQGDPAEIVVDVSPTVERLDEVVVEWPGGHPGVDLPAVVLEVEQDGSFVPARKAGDRIYDDTGFELMIEYAGDCNRSNCSDHRWRLRWQERIDFPLGRYRFVISGRALTSEVGNYRTTSREFDLVPSTQLAVESVVPSAAGVVVQLHQPPTLRFEEDGDVFRAVDRSFLLRSTVTPGDVGAALPEQASLVVSGFVRPVGSSSTAVATDAVAATVMAERRKITGRDEAGALTYGGGGTQPTTEANVGIPEIAGGPAGDYLVSLTLTDRDGNSGTVTATVTKP